MASEEALLTRGQIVPDMKPPRKPVQLTKDDPEQLIRADAINALGETKDEAWTSLIASAGMSDRLVVASSSANALDTIDTPAARQALKDVRATRKSIATALSMLDSAVFA